MNPSSEDWPSNLYSSGQKAERVTGRQDKPALGSFCFLLLTVDALAISETDIAEESVDGRNICLLPKLELLSVQFFSVGFLIGI